MSVENASLKQISVTGHLVRTKPPVQKDNHSAIDQQAQKHRRHWQSAPGVGVFLRSKNTDPALESYSSINGRGRRKNPASATTSENAGQTATQIIQPEKVAGIAAKKPSTTTKVAAEPLIVTDRYTKFPSRGSGNKALLENLIQQMGGADQSHHPAGHYVNTSV